MLRGLYSGATALQYQERQHQITASNLAHLNTVGHRRSVFSVGENTNGPDGAEDRPGAVAASHTDFLSEGRMQRTDRKLDLAIRGKGFFQFQGGEGTIYSKNGVLFRNPDGQLQNRDGLPLLGENGPVVIPPNIAESQIVIAEDGAISANGNSIDKLAIVEFDDPNLLAGESQTDFLIGTAVAKPAGESAIEQGSRELSNAQPVTELINLIVSARHFEAAQRAIRAISDSIQQSTQQQ